MGFISVEPSTGGRLSLSRDASGNVVFWVDPGGIFSIPASKAKDIVSDLEFSAAWDVTLETAFETTGVGRVIISVPYRSQDYALIVAEHPTAAPVRTSRAELLRILDALSDEAEPDPAGAAVADERVSSLEDAASDIRRSAEETKTRLSEIDARVTALEEGLRDLEERLSVIVTHHSLWDGKS